MTEPLSTALGAAVAGALLAISAALSRTGRIGIPVAVLFLVVGMLAGQQGLGRVPFDDYELAFRTGSIALALILFDGGLNTPLGVLRRHAVPAALLATAGVAGTAALVALFARAIGLEWGHALLLGAVVSSTDAAAVFSVLRGAGLRIAERVGATLELESGLNDPMAVVLTITLTEAVLAGETPGWGAIAMVPVQFAIGAALGAGFGFAGRWLLLRLRPIAIGLFPVLTLALVGMAFGVTTLARGSGFLAVYIAGMVLGSGPLPYRPGILRVHDFLAWLAQVAMFLMLGLLAYPSELLGVFATGLAIALFLAVLARPVIVALGLVPFRYTAREIGYVGWVGLRGAIPIVLAAYPVLRGVEGSIRLFDIVFFVVAVSALLQGGTVRWLTRLLKLEAKTPPPPPAVVEVTSAQPIRERLMTFYIHPASAVAGATIAEMPFPPDSAVILIDRGTHLIAPRGHVRLEVGDHVHVFSTAETEGLIRLLFGQLQDHD